MVRHGVSHASVALVCMLVGDLLSRELFDRFPWLHGYLAVHVAPWLERGGVLLSAEVVGSLLSVVLLGFLWGMVFRVLEKG